MNRKGKALLKYICARGGKLAYCGCVAVALTAIAIAAEQFRTENPAEEAPLILPAAEISAPMETGSEFMPPEDASLLRAFERLPEWNEELYQWETHHGVDYLLPEDRVMSLSAGTVRTVGRSGVYGGFVEVEAGEYLLRYASIAPKAGIQPGDDVEIGDLIGISDASLPGESGQGAHLHLELERDETLLNYAAMAAKKPD